jgi:membrane-bound inhibitor of C-type lysozyme
MRIQARLVIVLAATALAAACATGAARKVAFRCSAGEVLTATFEERKVTLALPDGRTATLMREASGSSARYGDGHLTLWLDANKGFVEEQGVILHRDCIEVTASEATQE